MIKYKGGLKQELNLIFGDDFCFSNFTDFLNIRTL